MIRMINKIEMRKIIYMNYVIYDQNDQENRDEKDYIY